MTHDRRPRAEARSTATPFAVVAVLLFASGLCALVYQVAWLRLLRLVFGASTAASAAVLAIFLGGLGLGSLLLGRRADRTMRPLLLWAKLEAGIALFAALSPVLVGLVHRLYVALGGAIALGPVLGTVSRLVLATVVLGGTTFLMGGTLPAAARAVTQGHDLRRRRLALLYAWNTLGAVLGALLTTFVAIELLGVRRTVFAAAGLNLLVAGLAFWLARRSGRSPVAKPEPKRSEDAAAAPRGFVLAAAAAVGFAFLVLELVWYRMLAPLLGGTSYTFGLILAVALAGIGVGGALYAAFASRLRPSLATFAASCGIEAFFVALPFAIGDRLAVLAMLLQPLGDIDFWLLATAWSVLTATVVAPTAIIAGFQFPLLVALLGRGAPRLGRDVGAAYAWNTAGAITGSLAGGFVLMPLVGALGMWRGASLLLVLVGAVAAVIDLQRRSWATGQAVAAAAGLATVLCLTTTGPTAVWRHTPIGVGGMPAAFDGPNDLRNMHQAVRRAIVWQADGRESSVAIHALDEISFLISGKSDGSAIKDAPTQIMSGLIGAALHPDPRRALVIGLGTGSSAGWLAAVPSIEQVDVYELEPAILEVARRCAPVNHDALANEKVTVIIGDGRELLLTTDARYDVIFSEPSNPYRAGIASLFTRELYQAARARLSENGIFLQWLQGYDIDSQIVRKVLATLRSEFGAVESWQVHTNDLLLVASARRLDHDLARLRRRMAEEPFASALANVLGGIGAHAFYTGFVAGPGLATAVLRAEGDRLNTDDHPIIEFGFARGLGRDLEFSVERLARLAAARGESLPSVRGGRLDPLALAEARSVRNALWRRTTRYRPTSDRSFDLRVEARNAYVRGELARAAELWQRQDQTPTQPFDRVAIAESLAAAGDPAFPSLAEDLDARDDRFSAAAVRARYAFTAGEAADAGAALALAFESARTDPWAHHPLLQRSLLLASKIAQLAPEVSGKLFEALGEPFAVSLLDDLRNRVRVELAQIEDFEDRCLAALAPFEPHIPWEQGILTLRLRCYQAVDDPRMPTAKRDLEAFFNDAPPRLIP